MINQQRVQHNPKAVSKSSLASEDHKLRLLVTCPDQKGLVAAISSFFEKHHGNILRIDQYLQPGQKGRLFLRMEIDDEGFGLGPEKFRRQFAGTWKTEYSWAETAR